MKLKIAIALAALAVGGAGAIAAQAFDSCQVRATGIAETTFMNPTSDGKSVDIRFAAHMRPDPAFTAERFCLDHGFARVSNYVIRSAGVTRTIGDEQTHEDTGGSLDAFALIACGPVQIAGR